MFLDFDASISSSNQPRAVDCPPTNSLPFLLPPSSGLSPPCLPAPTLQQRQRQNSCERQQKHKGVCSLPVVGLVGASLRPQRGLPHHFIRQWEVKLSVLASQPVGSPPAVPLAIMKITLGQDQDAKVTVSFALTLLWFWRSSWRNFSKNVKGRIGIASPASFCHSPWDFVWVILQTNTFCMSFSCLFVGIFIKKTQLSARWRCWSMGIPLPHAIRGGSLLSAPLTTLKVTPIKIAYVLRQICYPHTISVSF